MSVLLDLNMVRDLIEDLNKEVNYKLNENETNVDKDLLAFSSDGTNHSIFFAGLLLFDSSLEKEMEDIPVHVEINLNEREHFEKHIRNLINDKINILKDLEV